MPPFVTNSVTVKRKQNVTDDTGNITPGVPTVIASGVQITIEPAPISFQNAASGPTFVGSYRGVADIGTNILPGDTLFDEALTDNEGNAVQYRVNDAVTTILYLRLYLTKIQVGI